MDVEYKEDDAYGPPFPPEEYNDRIRKVKREMDLRGLDTLLVTSPPNITYLTGYDSIWYDQPVTTGVAVRRDTDGIIFFDTHFHKELVAQTAYVAGEVVHHRGWAGRKQVLATLMERGWLKGNIGVERWSRSPGHPVLTKVEEGIRDLGGTVVDGSWCVDVVKLVKSPLEVESVRRAAVIADAGMLAVKSEMRIGMTEIEVQGIAHYAMSKLQGEEPAIRTIVRSGPRSSAHHGLPSRRRIRPGEIIGVDFSSSYNRYHVDLSRCFFIGDPDPRWLDLFQRAAGSIRAVVRAAKPGDPMTRIQQIADEYVDANGLRDKVWFVGGYDLGISIPPDWVGHTFLGGDRFEAANFDVGVVTNYENIFDVLHENWPGGRNGNYIDSLLMTENGLEILSKLPQELTVL